MYSPFSSSNPLAYTGIDLYTQPQFINANRAPTINDIYNPGTQWQNNAANPVVIYETTGAGVWALSNATSSSLNTLTGNTGTASPVANNIQIAGTANEITTAASGGVITLTVPSTFIAPGTIASTTTLTSGTTLTATAGNITATAGNVVINGAGKMLQVHHGAVTDFCGTGTLVLGTVTIANTNIATGDQIYLTRTGVAASTTLGQLTYTIIASTSFTVTSVILGTPGSTQTGDVSTFAYFIVRPV